MRKLRNRRKPITNLKFADDIVLIEGNKGNLQITVEQLEEEGKKAGMIINLSKTKLLVNRTNLHIKIKKLNVEENIKYLGEIFILKTDKDKRVATGWNSFWTFEKVTDNLRQKLKYKIFNSYVLPRLT